MRPAFCSGMTDEERDAFLRNCHAVFHAEEIETPDRRSAAADRAAGADQAVQRIHRSRLTTGGPIRAVSITKQNFADMREKKEELYGALMAISEKRQRARQALQATQGAEIGFRNKSPRKELPADLRAALARSRGRIPAALDQQYEKIQQRWQEYASCRRSLLRISALARHQNTNSAFRFCRG